jgi:hypothetical protein
VTAARVVPGIHAPARGGSESVGEAVGKQRLDARKTAADDSNVGLQTGHDEDEAAFPEDVPGFEVSVQEVYSEDSGNTYTVKVSIWLYWRKKVILHSTNGEDKDESDALAGWDSNCP